MVQPLFLVKMHTFSEEFRRKNQVDWYIYVLPHKNKYLNVWFMSICQPTTINTDNIILYIILGICICERHKNLNRAQYDL